MKRHIVIIVTLIFVGILAGCNKGDDQLKDKGNTNIDNNQEQSNLTENTSEEHITVTDLEGKTVQFDHSPKRIIALSAGDLETIATLGGEVVGRPIIRGDVPEAFKDIPEVGTSKDINIEKIISLDPDLIIVHPELNANEIPTLEEMGIEVLQTGADSIQEIQASIEMFGEILQKEEKAKELIEDIDQKVGGLNTDKELRTLLVFGVPGSLMVALPDTLSGSMLEAVGGYNVANDFPELDDYQGYAQLETEKILEADPEAIFLITPGPQETAMEGLTKEIEKNPAWKSISAVKNDHIIQLPNALFGANPGTKITDSLDYLYQEIESIQNK